MCTLGLQRAGGGQGGWRPRAQRGRRKVLKVLLSPTPRHPLFGSPATVGAEGTEPGESGGQACGHELRGAGKHPPWPRPRVLLWVGVTRAVGTLTPGALGAAEWWARPSPGLSPPAAVTALHRLRAVIQGSGAGRGWGPLTDGETEALGAGRPVRRKSQD